MLRHVMANLRAKGDPGLMVATPTCSQGQDTGQARPQLQKLLALEGCHPAAPRGPEGGRTCPGSRKLVGWLPHQVARREASPHRVVESLLHSKDLLLADGLRRLEELAHNLGGRLRIQPQLLPVGTDFG